MSIQPILPNFTIMATASDVGTVSAISSIGTASSQEFTFNVEIVDIFSNADFGSLFIIGQEDEILLYDDADTIGLDEYSEGEFTGNDENAADIAAFDTELSKILAEDSASTTTDPTTGQVTGPEPSYKGTIKTNMREIALAAKAIGITSKNAIYSMIAIASGESGLVPKSESHVYGYNNLVRVFTGLTVGQANRATKIGITKREFFNIVYGEYNPSRVGNRNVSDGGLYYGRGFIQLTGYENYKKYNDLLKRYFPNENNDIINNPELVNDARVAAKITALYFKSRVQIDPNSSLYFSHSLVAVGKDANGGYDKKTKFYNELNSIKNPSFLA